jgi:isoleucyl-tRNA synthetase
LPGNLALAVNPELEYCLIENNGEKYILAKDRLVIIEGDFEILKQFKGKILANKKYEPIFPYFENIETENKKNAFQVLLGEFVTAEDGTGIVHINPMHGEEDYNLGQKYKLPTYHLVDEIGNFTKQAIDYENLNVKEADKKIIKDLKENNVFYKQELIVHEYPYCWRCDTPLLYYALESWYILVTELKEKLLANNQKINWVPGHIKEGRFGKWLEGVRDWNFAEIVLGAPIPIWECPDCKKTICIESVAE